jgi:uncharacterized membrane protein
MQRDDPASGPGAPLDAGPPSDLHTHAHSLIGRRAARNLNILRAEEVRTVGQRMSDGITRAAGSWRFIIIFLVILAGWMAVNVIAGIKHWDPYPFILLNLLLSCVAAIQAPIILMSQNREESRDRLRAEADYQINLKAEILLEHLTQEVESLRAELHNYRGGSSG